MHDILHRGFRFLIFLLGLGTLLIPVEDVRAIPYQLLENEAAILIGRNETEIRYNFHRDYGLIPTDLLRLHLRYGVFSWMEMRVGGTYADFTEEGEQRHAESFFTLKFSLFNLVGYQFFTYLKLRKVEGEPVFVDINDLGNVTRAVSPYADQGQDGAIGILARQDNYYSGFAVTLGLEYMLATNRNYGDFLEDEDVFSLLVAPQWLTAGRTLMLAVENKYSYWVERGGYLEILPQIRWEFYPQAVVEAGVMLQMVGARSARSIIGFTYEF